MKYFAVQILANETTTHVAGLLCKTAKNQKTLFRTLKLLDTFQVGTRTFARFESDLQNLDPILDSFKEERSIIRFDVSTYGYVLYTREGLTGNVSMMTMHCPAKPGQSRNFRGPKIKNWEAQFSKLS